MEVRIQLRCPERKLVSQTQLGKYSFQPDQAFPLQSAYRVSKRQKLSPAATKESAYLKRHLRELPQGYM
jgi:hypothetical protein